MKKIIVPTDFSDQAAHALKLAVDIAKQSSGEIILSHVVDLPILQDPLITNSLYVNDSIVKDSTAKAQKGFDKLIAKYKGTDVNIKTTVEYGNTTMATLKLIETKKADLVVMGTKGATGLKEYFVGSNTEKIVRGSKAPVISVPKASKIGSIKNIAFPNSLREENEELTLKVKALQDFFKAKLHIVFVNTPGFFKRDYETIGRLKTYAKRYMFTNFRIHVYNDISEQEGTMNFADEVDADLIALGTHGKRGISHMFTGSIAEDIVNHEDRLIWTYRLKK